MNPHCKAIRALGALAGHYPNRWAEVSEWPMEKIYDFLRAEGWHWNPTAGLLGRWEKTEPVNPNLKGSPHDQKT